jgi:hypothetical protein
LSYRQLVHIPQQIDTFAAHNRGPYRRRDAYDRDRDVHPGTTLISGTAAQSQARCEVSPLQGHSRPRWHRMTNVPKHLLLGINHDGHHSSCCLCAPRLLYEREPRRPGLFGRIAVDHGDVADHSGSILKPRRLRVTRTGFDAATPRDYNSWSKHSRLEQYGSTVHEQVRRPSAADLQRRQQQQSHCANWALHQPSALTLPALPPHARASELIVCAVVAVADYSGRLGSRRALPHQSHNRAHRIKWIYHHVSLAAGRPCHAMTRWRERGTLLGPAQGGARRPQGGALARGSRRRGLRGLGCKTISLGGGPPTCTTSYEEGERLARIANRALGPGDVPLSFRAASRVSPMQIVSARQSTRQNGKQVRTLAGGPSRRSQPPNAWPSPAS